MFSFLYCNRKRAGWKKKIHNGSQWLVSPFPCAISLCIDFADLGLQSDRCFLHDSCSSSMSSRVRDILKFTSKICLQHLFNLFENVRTNELGTFAANLFACKSLLTMILAESWHITKWSVDVLSDWLLFFHLFPPGGLGSRRSIGAMLSSVPLLRQSCQEMGQSRPVHVEKDFW